jgi:hypothetical protein
MKASSLKSDTLNEKLNFDIGMKFFIEASSNAVIKDPFVLKDVVER